MTSGVLFGASLLLLLAVRVNARPDSAEHAANGRHGLRDGLRYIRDHKALLPLITVVGLSEMCFSGPVGAGLVLLADERGWSTSGMGWIASAFSIGATAASLLLTVRATIARAGQAIGLSLLVTAAATAALGNAGTLVAAIVFSGLVGVASGLTMAVTGGLVQTVVDPDYLGRVTSVTTLFTLGLSPVLFPAVGFTVDLWGAAVFFTGCGGICLLAAIVALTARSVRDARLSPPGAVGSVGDLTACRRLPGRVARAQPCRGRNDVVPGGLSRKGVIDHGESFRGRGRQLPGAGQQPGAVLPVARPAPRARRLADRTRRGHPGSVPGVRRRGLDRHAAGRPAGRGAAGRRMKRCGVGGRW
ncbi:MFS transporter [Mangrovihabitans endophyticus]|uniref:Major Facilitator Superfamily protein n=1 Tax=Mangrovihabitans endophyticus TaxID=1751298 RepID=A0A8J3BUN2_9ACTN|nr:hypothetical protein GCM10012284_12460 [Mangrovihabitans endophyticus]